MGNQNSGGANRLRFCLSLLGIVVLVLLIQSCQPVVPINTPTALATNTFVPTSTATTTNTPKPSATPLPPSATPPPTNSPTPTIVLQVSAQDEAVLVYVPAGPFVMGSDDYFMIELAFTLTLDAFWIDQTEVTNQQYRKCVGAGACAPSQDISSATRPDYHMNAEYADYPVINVSWFQAQEYCAWAGRRLPTEAEWEKAARGTQGYKYPWGNKISLSLPLPNLANIDSNVGDTAKVGSYPKGASPYGVLDMGGNVQEWVSSLYRPYPYNKDDGREDLTYSTEARVLRSATWYDPVVYLWTFMRQLYTPTRYFYGWGFRCALSATP